MIVSDRIVCLVCVQDADVAILLGGFPRLPGMLRKDLIAKNVAIMLTQVSK
jgi:malate/lactate dehydrogenase